MKQFAKSFTDAVAAALEKLMIALVVAMMGSLMWQVFTRFVIKVPSIWTEEVARYTFLGLVMIGAALGVRNSSHFGMTMFSDKLTGVKRDFYCRYVINGIIVLCSIFQLVYGIEFTVQYGMTRVSPTFLLPMAWVFAIIPISALLMILFASYNVVYGDFTADPHACQDDDTGF
jgi:TRAP-type C4-dicarboxylate transport system permease small subunit